MFAYQLSQALELFWRIVLPLGGAVVGGGLVFGIIQTVARVEDRSVGLAGRLAGLFVVLLLAGKLFADWLQTYAVMQWGGK